MNKREKKKRDKKILKSGDLSYCRHCGNTNIWQVYNDDWTVASMYCTKCGWKCGNVKKEEIEESRTIEQEEYKKTNLMRNEAVKIRDL